VSRTRVRSGAACDARLVEAAHMLFCRHDAYNTTMPRYDSAEAAGMAASAGRRAPAAGRSRVADMMSATRDATLSALPARKVLVSR